MANLNAEQLRRLARLGAMARLQQLKEEEAAIRAVFPELLGGRRAAADSGGGQRRRRRRTKMSVANRQAVSERMKKYWAERRKAKGK